MSKKPTQPKSIYVKRRVSDRIDYVRIGQWKQRDGNVLLEIDCLPVDLRIELQLGDLDCKKPQKSLANSAEPQ